MEEKINLILSELQGLKGELQGVKGELQGVKGELKGLNQRVGNVELGQNALSKHIDDVETELKDFRSETQITLQLIQNGQQGTREEITQRFNEVKRSVDHLEADISYTYHKTAQHELVINRMKNQ